MIGMSWDNPRGVVPVRYPNGEMPSITHRRRVSWQKTSLKNSHSWDHGRLTVSVEMDDTGDFSSNGAIATRTSIALMSSMRVDVSITLNSAGPEWRSSGK